MALFIWVVGTVWYLHMHLLCPCVALYDNHVFCQLEHSTSTQNSYIDDIFTNSNWCVACEI
jgi:hypothetical protein